MTGGSIRDRLKALEARTPPTPCPSDARRRMTEHLDRLAALRRGELSEEEAAEVRATNAALEERLASRRGGA
ncbi:MAG: hypothetical protein M3R38_10890 [Actinomycetota bacterium]|nr:hypothetical protein [Actinomycetota bacterium]MDP9476170.1 hypothetical protein [Actinomycetota bacterium]